MRRLFITAMTLALLMGLTALPAVAGGPQEKATGAVFLEQDSNVRYSEFAIFEASNTKEVKGTYYWSRDDKGEFWGVITDATVDPSTGTATFFGTTYDSSNTGWVANGCTFRVDIVDGGTPGAGVDTYHFTWVDTCGGIGAGVNRLYQVNGGNLVVHGQ